MSRLVAVSMLLVCQLATAAQMDAKVAQPRPFGYAVGDLVSQRVQLEGGFEPTELPRPGRFGAWLERRTAVIEDGSLKVEYQIINAPQALTTVTIPAWALESKSGDVLRISAAPISVAPLTTRTPFTLRPDRSARVIATEPLWRRIGISLGALALTMGGWLGWLLWRNWQASRNQPFARALREIRRVDETAPQAWQALHAAFDRTAGRVIQVETLPVLFAHAPHLATQRARIEEFFVQSTERFFGTGALATPVSVGALCADLRRIEKRNE